MTKKRAVFLIALLLLCAGATVLLWPRSTAPIDGALAESRPAVDDQTSTTSYTIQRIKLDSKGLALNVYYEIPVFEDGRAGYQKINAFFADLAEQFFSSENENLQLIWDGAREMDDLYWKWTAQVTFWNDKLVSVTLSESWMAGGVNDRGNTGYTFRTDTGELLTLSQVTGKPDSELKETILRDLKDALQRHSSAPEESLAAAEEYAVDDFDFGLTSDGYVQLYFDRYELDRPGAESTLTVYPWLYAAREWDTWK